MARQSLFERMQREVDFNKEYWKIYQIVYRENVFRETIIEVFSAHFREWTHRDNFLSFDELFNELRFSHNTSYYIKEETCFLFFEVLFNLGNAFMQHMNSGLKTITAQVLETIVLDLQKVGYCMHKTSNGSYIIVETDPAATAVAEISPPDLSDKVIEYNHFLIRGDLEKKKGILRALANELEPKRRTLERLNKGLTNQLFALLNNANIRHNNVESGDDYQPVIANMEPAELENVYDDTYQMALLASLLLDNVERSERMKELLARFGGKADD